MHCCYLGYVRLFCRFDFTMLWFVVGGKRLVSMALRITMVPPELVLRIANLGTGDPETRGPGDLYKDGPLCPKRERRAREEERRPLRKTGGDKASCRRH